MRCFGRLLVAGLLLGWLAPLTAATFVLTNTSDSGAGSLRQALADARAQPGPHMIDATGLTGNISVSGAPLPAVVEHIVLNGPGAAQLTLQHGAGPTIVPLEIAAAGNFTVNGVRIANTPGNCMLIGEGGSVALNNCVVAMSAGIDLRGRLRLQDCTVESNAGTAAIFANTQGTWPALTCRDTTFASNTCNIISGPGAGAILALYGDILIEDCVFTSNICLPLLAGGAMMCGGNLIIRRSLFQGNQNINGNNREGGALHIRADAAVPTVVSIEDSHFVGNFSSRFGGAVFCAPTNVDVRIRNSTFNENTAQTGAGQGGGLFVACPAVVHNCTFTGNQSGSGGGAFYSGTGTGEIVHCTFVQNTTGGEGGGLFTSTPILAPNILMRNNVIADNIGHSIGPDFRLGNRVTSMGGNLIGLDPFANFPAISTDQIGTTAAPIDPMLAPLNNNGGPVPTMLPLPGSPLIDQGVPGPTLTFHHDDARDFPRVFDQTAVANAAGGDGSDIGAAEIQPPWVWDAPPVLRFTAPATSTPSAATAVDVQWPASPQTLSMIAGAPFEVSLSQTTGFSSTVQITSSGFPATVYVRYHPQLGTSHSALLELSSTNGVQYVALEGEIVPPGLIEPDTPLLIFRGVRTFPSLAQSYTLTGQDLTGPVTVTAGGEFEVSLAATSGFGTSVVSPAPVGGTLAPVTIFVRYLPATVHANTTGTLTHTSPGVQPSVTNLQGFSLEGLIDLTPASVRTTGMTFQTTGFTPSAEQSYVLTGENFAAPVTINASAGFEVSLTSGSGFGPSVVSAPPVHYLLPATTIFVRFAPVTGGVTNGSLQHDAVNLPPVPVSLTGTANAPGPIIISQPSMSFQQTGTGTPTAAQSYDVSATNIQDPISLSVSGPFEISFSAASGFGTSLVTAAPVGGTIPQTTVYVRYLALNAGTQAGTIDHSSPLAASVTLVLSGTVHMPAIQLSTAGLQLLTSAHSVPSNVESYTVSGTNLIAAVTLAAPQHFEISFSSTGGFGSSLVSPAPVANTLAATTVYVRYNPSSGSVHSGVISHDSPQATTATLSVDGEIVAPTAIHVSANSLSFTTVAVGIPSIVESYVVSGTTLTAAITVTAPAPFQVSLSAGGPFATSVSTAAPVNRDVPPTDIYVRYAPSAGTAHQGAIANASPGAQTQTVSLNGTVTPPLITVSTSTLQFVAPHDGGPSPEQSYTVEGIRLNSPIALTTAAPFEMSLTPGGPYATTLQSGTPAAGVVAPTTIYVRYAPTAAGPDTGAINHNSPGAATASVSLSGSVAAAPPPPPKETGTSSSDGGSGCANPGSKAGALALAALLLAITTKRRRLTG